MSQISPKSNSISAIIRFYKSAVSRHAKRLGFDNGWQTSFHDCIKRNVDERQRIEIYIQNNPKKWKGDVFLANKYQKNDENSTLRRSN
jgi:hypothetical protein